MWVTVRGSPVGAPQPRLPEANIQQPNWTDFKIRGEHETIGIALLSALVETSLGLYGSNTRNLQQKYVDFKSRCA